MLEVRKCLAAAFREFGLIDFFGGGAITLRADATLLLRPFTAFSLAYFSTTGSRDPLLYTAAPISGSAARPDNDGWILQVDFLPIQNIQLIVQYTLYDKFNGTRNNYDGAGRSASDNNTLFLLAMFDF